MACHNTNNILQNVNYLLMANRTVVVIWCTSQSTVNISIFPDFLLLFASCCSPLGIHPHELVLISNLENGITAMKSFYSTNSVLSQSFSLGPPTPQETDLLWIESQNISTVSVLCFYSSALFCLISTQSLLQFPTEPSVQLSKNVLHSSPHKQWSDKSQSEPRNCSPFSCRQKTLVQTHNALIGALKHNVKRWKGSICILGEGDNIIITSMWKPLRNHSSPQTSRWWDWQRQPVTFRKSSTERWNLISLYNKHLKYQGVLKVVYIQVAYLECTWAEYFKYKCFGV